MDESKKEEEIEKYVNDQMPKKNEKGVTILDVMDEGKREEEEIKKDGNDPMPQKNEKDVLWYIFFIYFTSPFLYGYNLCVLNNPAVMILSKLLEEYSGYLHVKTLELIDNDYTLIFGWSVVNAIYVFSGFLVVMFAEKITSRLGRRKTFLINTILMIIATLCGVLSGIPSAVSSKVSWMIVIMYRILAGLYCGIGMEASKFSENSTTTVCETYCICSQISMTAGIFVSSILGLSTVFGNSYLLPCLLLINGFLAFLNLLLCLVMESPRCNLNKTTDTIKDQHQLISVKGLFSRIPKLKKEVFFACLLQIAQQFIGINVIVAYSSFTIHDSGVDDSHVEWIVCGTMLAYFLMTPITLILVLQSKRTKLMLLLTTLFMAVAFVMLFMTSSLCQDYNPKCAYFEAVAMLLYIVSFSVGFGPYISMTRFRPDEQSAAFNVSTACNLLCNSFVMVIFLPLQKFLGSYIFLVLASISVVIAYAINTFLPETKPTKNKEGIRVVTKDKNCVIDSV